MGSRTFWEVLGSGFGKKRPPLTVKSTKVSTNEESKEGTFLHKGFLCSVSFILYVVFLCLRAGMLHRERERELEFELRRADCGVCQSWWLAAVNHWLTQSFNRMTSRFSFASRRKRSRLDLRLRATSRLASTFYFFLIINL